MTDMFSFAHHKRLTLKKRKLPKLLSQIRKLWKRISAEVSKTKKMSKLNSHASRVAFRFWNSKFKTAPCNSRSTKKLTNVWPMLKLGNPRPSLYSYLYILKELVDVTVWLCRLEWQKADAEFRRVEEEKQLLDNQLKKDTSLIESKKRMLEEYNQKVEQLRGQLEKARSDVKQ